jgi:hypothetical protein
MQSQPIEVLRGTARPVRLLQGAFGLWAVSPSNSYLLHYDLCRLGNDWLSEGAGVAKVGVQADVLRALGRFLDDQSARQIQIEVHSSSLEVTWETMRSGTRNQDYREHDLESLRRQARRMRRIPQGTPDGSLAEMLRTLGQELDSDGIDVAIIIQEGETFRVSGTKEDRYVNRLYFMSELEMVSDDRRQARGTGQDDPVLSDPFSQVTVGLLVSTRDQQSLGKVSAIRGRHFKVATPRLQRDFWLPAGCIASIAPEEAVRLIVAKADLHQYKSWTLSS